MTEQSAVVDHPEAETSEVPPQELGAGVATDGHADIEAAEREADNQLADTALDHVQEPEQEAGSTAPATESHEVPIHRATCQHKGCSIGVVYRPTASGQGFMVLESHGVEVNTTFGRGEHGIPVCPNGHGEMTLADHELPAGDAITEAAARVEREQKPARLPFPSPPFNYAGVLHTIQEKRHEVKDLEREFERKDEARKKAKTALDEANTELGQMLDDFEEREAEWKADVERRERAAANGTPEGLVRCVYERENDGKACPLCISGGPSLVRGEPIAARNSDRHAEQVVAFLEDVDLESLLEQLSELAGVVVSHNRLKEWTPEQRAEVQAYVEQLLAVVPGGPPVSVKRPSVFAGMHLAAAVEEGAKVQACKECGTTLLVFGDADVDDDPYPTGTLVGADCPGGEIEPHRYPKREKKKAAPKKAEPKAAKGKKPGGKGKRQRG